MEAVLDTLVILLWMAFSLATLLGVIHEFQKPAAAARNEHPIDNEGVYLLDPPTQSDRNTVSV